jgi:uncharacterized membrane protein YqaE (UPF0057 family)
LLRDEKISRGTTLIAVLRKNCRLKTESDNSCPDDGGRPDTPTKIFFRVSAQECIYISFQRLLAPTAVSLSAGIFSPDMLIADIFLSVMAFC